MCRVEAAASDPTEGGGALDARPGKLPLPWAIMRVGDVWHSVRRTCCAKKRLLGGADRALAS